MRRDESHNVNTRSIVLAHYYWIINASRSRLCLLYGQSGTHDGNFIGHLPVKARDDL